MILFRLWISLLWFSCEGLDPDFRMSEQGTWHSVAFAAGLDLSDQDTHFRRSCDPDYRLYPHSLGSTQVAASLIDSFRISSLVIQYRTCLTGRINRHQELRSMLLPHCRPGDRASLSCARGQFISQYPRQLSPQTIFHPIHLDGCFSGVSATRRLVANGR